MEMRSMNREEISGTKFVKKSSCRAAVILLSLLCLLLLIGVIILAFLFTQAKFQREKEMGKEKALQTSYNNLKTERDRLQKNYDSVVEDRIQLQKRVENMTKERYDLQKTLQDFQQKWIYIRGSFYYISSERKPWRESRQDCLRKDADLMIINNQDEQSFVNRFKNYLWIGLTDLEDEGKWKWVDGTPVSTSYWSSGEPNGHKTENCGQIKSYNSQNSWNDESCSVLHYWICEKRGSV